MEAAFVDDVPPATHEKTLCAALHDMPAGDDVMPRYFFTIRWPDRRVEDDPCGMLLPNEAAALSQAERAVARLATTPGYDHPELMMIIQDESRRSVWSIPFLPGRA